MRFHFLQHVPFEDAANIGVWARSRGFEVTVTQLYAQEALPSVQEIDWLGIMGGPMNIYEYDRYPWLAREKGWIKEVIEANKPVIGICLGAQLIADVLGGPVQRNPHTEIGWYPVTLTEAGQQDSLLSQLPTTFNTFHWHGDSFAIPPGATHLASSAACTNQAFQYGDRVLGLQCHLDYSVASLQAMVQHCGNELMEGPFIQTDTEILTDAQRAQQLQPLLFMVLDAMSAHLSDSPTMPGTDPL